MRLPRPANDNLPKALARNALARTALRGILPRLIPYAGLALLAYDLYKLYSGQQNGTAPGVVINAGWQLCYTCPPPAQSEGQELYYGGHIDNCAPGLCPGQEAGPMFTSTDPTWRNLQQWTANKFLGPLTRYSLRRVWHRPNSGPRIPHSRPAPFGDTFPEPMPAPHAPPRWRPRPDEKEIPVTPPWADPFSWPPDVWPPLPVPPPYRVIPGIRPNPWRSPGEQPRRGPGPDPRSPSPWGDPRGDPWGDPRNRPNGQPGPQVEIWPSPSERPNPDQRPRPNRPGEKEKKVGGAMPVFIRGGLNLATEGADAVTAIWEAIPWRDRIRYHEGKRKPTIQERARAIYDLWDKLDGIEAVKNLAENQLEDFAFGKLGKTAGKARRHSVEEGYAPNSGRGFQSGPWDTVFSDFPVRGF